jgi:predicted Zn-dependent protease
MGMKRVMAAPGRRTDRSGRGLRTLTFLAVSLLLTGAAALALLSDAFRPDTPRLDPLIAAKVAFADGDLAKAESLARSALDRRPDDPGAQLLLGRMLLAQGRAIETYPHFTAVLAKDPQNAVARRGLADAFAALEQQEPHAPRAAASATTPPRSAIDPAGRVPDPLSHLPRPEGRTR